MPHRVRAEPGIRFISRIFRFSCDNFHHLIRVSGGRTDFHSHFPKFFHRFQHIWLGFCKLVQNPQKFFLKKSIKAVNVFFCHFMPVFFQPKPVNSFHGKHGFNVISFQHSHGFPHFLHSRFNTEVFKDFHKSLHRCKTSKVYRSSCPVKNYRFYFSHFICPPESLS